MSIVVVGVNHRSATVAVRERLAFSESQATAALDELRRMEPQAEFVVLSTCNRVELYCSSDQDPQPLTDRLIGFLSSFHHIEPSQFRCGLYVHEDEQAVRHLLRVSAGLDSMVVGEAQILGQVKASYSHACACKTTGKILNRLFHCAFSTAKNVHTNTAISNGRVSVAGVAVELALQLFAEIARAKVVVIGAGETGELLIQHLLKAGCTDITVVNRTGERGTNLAQRCGVAAGKWEELDGQIGRANIVISSTATRDYLYTRESFERLVARPRGKSLLIVDVGVPRNFDPAINKIEDVYLYGMDELQDVAEQNRRAREEDVTSGLEIVYANAAEFMDWLRAKDIGPLIGRMKDEFRQISHREVEKFFVGSRQEASCRPSMEAMVDRVVNKLVHCVIKNVDAVAKESGPAEAAKLVDTICRQAREIASTSREQEDGQP